MRVSVCVVAALCIITFCTDEKVNAARILLVALASKSHMNEIDGVGEELLNRGHQVFFLLGNGTSKRFSKRYHFIEFDVDLRLDIEQDETFTKELLHMMLTKDKFHVIRKMMRMDIIIGACKGLAGNRVLLEEVKSKNIDLVIVNSIPLIKCTSLISDYVKSPLIMISSIYHGSNSGMHITNLPAQLDNQAWSMTFLQRVRNLMFHFMMDYSHFFIIDYKMLSEMAGYEYKSVESVISAAKMYLVNVDPVFQPPFLVPPHVRLVGGLGFRPPKPLDKEFQQFADDAKEGFVVFTFGSMFQYHPKELATRLAKAFQLVSQYKYVIRVSGEEAKLYGKNVKTAKWIPQNDLLAHPNCRAFITHCGNNGQTEALWNGVPMVGIPLAAEQPHNAVRMAERKFGVIVNIKDLTAEELAEAIVKVSAENSIYRKTIKRASAIFRKRSNPRKRAADAVEEVLSGEADFYYPEHIYELNLLQYYLFDVFLFLFLVAIVLLTSPIILICCCWKCYKKRKSKKEKTS